MAYTRALTLTLVRERALYRFLAILLLVTHFVTLPIVAIDVIADSEAPISVSGTAISGLFNSKETGLYNHVYRLVTEGYKKPISLQIEPIRRATRTFIDKKSECLFIGSDGPDDYLDAGISNEQLIVSQGIYPIRIHIYGPKSTSPFGSSITLKNKVIAVDMGVGTIDFISQLMGLAPQNVLTAQTLEQGFKMLDLGRISGLVAIDIDVVSLQKKDDQYLGYVVDKSFIIHESYDVFVCHRNERTISFIDHINSKLTQLKKTGILESLRAKTFPHAVGNHHQ